MTEKAKLNILLDSQVQGYDWTQSMVFPQPFLQWLQGDQVLNIFPGNKYYKDFPEMVSFIENECQEAIALDVDADMMRFASDHVTLDGFYLEMGVARGNTINFMAALNAKKTIYGFDSFEGLPEDWDQGYKTTPKGTFGFKAPQMTPAVLHNVKLIKGLFKDTLGPFKSKILKEEPIAFLHVDCDIYSSTCDILNALGDNLITGSIILFDEYYNYPSFREHEYKAFNEFLQSTGKKAKLIAFNQYSLQVVAQII